MPITALTLISFALALGILTAAYLDTKEQARNVRRLLNSHLDLDVQTIEEWLK